MVRSFRLGQRRAGPPEEGSGPLAIPAPAEQRAPIGSVLSKALHVNADESEIPMEITVGDP